MTNKNKYILILIPVGLLFVIYHILIELNISAALTSFDVWMTTGFKPSLPIIEIGGTSFLITFVYALVTKHKILNHENKTQLERAYLKIYGYLAIPPFVMYFIHLIYDHSGRWKLLENWTHPGKQPTHGSFLLFIQIIIASFIISLIGAAFGFGLGHLLRGDLPHKNKTI
jgi:hypothetical protein